jgi:prepilin-type N-terminal cleavage/methylation domain-containing protein
MTRARDERGFTLIEVLVAMVISLIVIGATATLLIVILNDNRYESLRAEAHADAGTMVDRLSRELRSASAPSGGSAVLAQATPYDIAFQTVNPTPGVAPSGNPTNQIWVRYCLGANNTLWRQSTPNTSTPPAVPDTSACPSTNSAWVPTASGSPCCVALNHVTNEIGGDTTRPLFTFGPAGWSSAAQINSVQVRLYVDNNPGHLPGPTQLISGIYLRNELAPPTARFVPTTQGTEVLLNGSLSSDPNGQVLTYQWYNGAACAGPSSAPVSGAISGATAQVYDAGKFASGSQQTFALVVTDSAGLPSCSSQVVAIP